MAALLALRTRHIPAVSGHRLHEELKSGLTYVRGHGPLVNLTALGFITTFLGTPLLTFLPLFAQDVIGGGVGQYTQLMAFAGAGAVTGAVTVAWLGTFRHMGRTLLTLQLMLGVLVLLFAMTRIVWLNEVLLFAAGVCMVMVFAMLASLVQLIAPGELRGRVTSIYMVAFRGGMPIGSLVAGWLANLSSAPVVMTMNGLLLSVVAAAFLLWSKDTREL
jgi:predicted MFS family arabinose efflux permease